MSVKFTYPFVVDEDTKIKYNNITSEQYEEFEREWILYILKEYRYGQAFCEHFDLGNATPLYHLRDEGMCRRWVEDNYLQK
jgi:hypothetical protein